MAKNDLTAISLAGEFNAHHREAMKSGRDFMENAVAAGIVAIKAKDSLPHGDWEGHVKQFYDCSMRVVQQYMKNAKDLGALSKTKRAALLDSTDSIRGLTQALSKAAPKPPEPTSDEQIPSPGNGRIDEDPPPGSAGTSPGVDIPTVDYGDAELNEAIAPEPEKPVSWFQRFKELWEAADDIGRTAIRAFFIDEKPKPKGFVRPTLAEVTDYCHQRGKGIDPEAWYDHYAANGWKCGKGSGKPMKDWQAAVRTWEKMKSAGASGKPADPRGNMAVLASYIEGLPDDG
jgi:hypothetical protein